MSESIISRGFLGLSANQNGLKKTSDAFLKDKSGVGLTFDTGKYVTLKGFEQIFSDVLKDINEKKTSPGSWGQVFEYRHQQWALRDKSVF